MRRARAGLIGGVAGMICGAVLIFYGFAFAAKPHRVGLAFAVTAAFIVVAGLFNWLVWRKNTSRAARSE